MTRDVIVRSILSIAVSVAFYSGTLKAQQAQTPAQLQPATASSVAATVPTIPDKATSFLLHTPPAYPSAELCAGIGGKVVLILAIDEHGSPTDVRIEHSSMNRELDRAAVNSARGWTFEPASKNGKAINSVVRIPVTFEARTPRGNCKHTSVEQSESNHPDNVQSSKSRSSADIAALTHAASQGDARAQNSLGFRYANGDGVPRDDFQAVDWYQKAAAQGNAAAQNNLGVMYAEGHGVEQSYAKAIEWYRMAAAQGYAKAQTSLGFRYATGQGVPQDYAQAIDWYRKAAGQNDAYAQSNLGVMYEKGRGVPRDYLQASSWYLKASAQGYARAQLKLGMLYRNGLGVSPDLVAAYALISLASAQSGPDKNTATNLLTDVMKGMTPAQIKDGQALASEMQSVGVVHALDDHSKK